MDRGSQEGLAPFAKYNEKSFSGRCILLQPLRRERLLGKKNTLLGRWENLPREKTKRQKEITVKHTQRRYISYKKEIANGTICPVEITLERLTKI